MRINTNINSMRTQEYMRQNQDKMNTSMNRLSSGKSINSAADDAAGLAIATRMRAKEGGLNVGARNTQDAMSALRTGDAALGSVSNILLRMRDLATQASSGTNNDKDIASMDKEYQALAQEIDHIAGKTNFNGNAFLNKGTDGKDITIQLSDASSDTMTIAAIETKKLTTDTLAVSADGSKKLDATTAAGEITKLDDAIQNIADARATFGSQLNRLDHNLNNVTSQATNMAASASQIEDADMAKEMSNMTKFKILNEAGISMLSQANQTPQMVSKLLQ
ncbi:flagellin [Bacillus cereus]|uniref:flagellin N-terminal helical domain-containing protein n=1 Tax=Bacillus TaxID=1386 RepID=UPI0002E1C1E3|nr:flagellin [Bacillus cereus]MCU4927356.1 flagellin [Bacillus cereus]MDA2255251.1 flagellin [Bacillus cereus]MDA2505319.1 flagellin [Bacillus cereus]MEC1980336.1 flagellin [Bacillus cereus]UUE90596.1 flagellin [Bacillus cereus]